MPNFFRLRSILYALIIPLFSSSFILYWIAFAVKLHFFAISTIGIFKRKMAQRVIVTTQAKTRIIWKVDYKSNEIPKMQELIKKFPAKNVIYRIDALHSQKKTMMGILKNESSYILEVKNNQKKLLKKVKFIAEYLPAISSDVMKEKNRGRIEIRKQLCTENVWI